VLGVRVHQQREPEVVGGVCLSSVWSCGERRYQRRKKHSTQGCRQPAYCTPLLESSRGEMEGQAHPFRGG